MTSSRQDLVPEPGPESIGAMLTRVRLATGRSQLRVAELLCAASGVATVTRHEVSRWEREERIPSGHWLRWLAVVLDVPLGELEHATAIARVRRGEIPATGDGLALRVAALRRMDDLVGGADLGTLVGRELAAAVRARDSSRRPGRLLPAVAELAQLACWVAADAGTPDAARAAYRIGVDAATAAGDRPLLGHLIGSYAHLTNDLGLARQGYRMVRAGGCAGTRALALHRVAFAAARAGHRRACEQALAEAERAYGRRDPDADPAWLYWFDDAELTAMTGRCFAALGRPRLAEPLLRSALADRRVRLRARALYTAWLAAAQLDAGEVERACGTARSALVTTIRVGSVRAQRQLAALHPRLLGHSGVPAAREYAEAARAARPYLPAPVGGGQHRPARPVPGGAGRARAGGDAAARAG